jgi:hypothetical protein
MVQPVASGARPPKGRRRCLEPGRRLFRRSGPLAEAGRSVRRRLTGPGGRREGGFRAAPFLLDRPRALITRRGSCLKRRRAPRRAPAPAATEAVAVGVRVVAIRIWTISVVVAAVWPTTAPRSPMEANATTARGECHRRRSVVGECRKRHRLRWNGASEAEQRKSRRKQGVSHEGSLSILSSQGELYSGSV